MVFVIVSAFPSFRLTQQQFQLEGFPPLATAFGLLCGGMDAQMGRSSLWEMADRAGLSPSREADSSLGSNLEEGEVPGLCLRLQSLQGQRSVTSPQSS